jgi:hypothetical protein
MVKVFNEKIELQGFNFQPGFVALVEGDNILATTSGWECNGCIFVYRPTEDGWRGDWESEETFPVQLVLDAIQDFLEGPEAEKSLR